MKIKIHPLFFLAGILSAIFGGLPVFVICALTALAHECGHIFCAARLGFECKSVYLMPYGGSAVCNIEGISPADEIKLALAGPAVNVVICVIVAGLWWFFPVTYAYTDYLFFASAAMLLLNLLPAYPLDGGRVVRCLFVKLWGAKPAEIILRVLSVLVAVGLVLTFVFWVRNAGFIAVALFLLCSAAEKSPPAAKINFAAKKRKRGRDIRYVILDENATYKEALKFIDGSRYLVLQIYGDKFIDEITEDELCEKLMHSSIYDKIIGDNCAE